MKRLFFGGIHPKYNKEMSISTVSLHRVTPVRVVIPMVQHIGVPCVPLVSVGDRVLLGQKIGATARGCAYPFTPPYPAWWRP